MTTFCVALQGIGSPKSENVTDARENVCNVCRLQVRMMDVKEDRSKKVQCMK
jgi:hypothetical protein